MTESVTIRPSALSGWPDCPRRGAARLFRREIEDAGFVLRTGTRGIGAVVGTSVHAAARVSLDEKLKTGSLPPQSFAIDAAAGTLHDELAQGPTLYDGPSGPTHNKSDALHQVIGMTRAYHRLVAPLVEPIQVEQRLEADIAPGVVLSGEPDTVAREPAAVRDLKTGATRAPRPAAPQLGAYSLLARSHGLAVERATIDFIRRVGVSKPQPEPTSTMLAVAAAETAALRIIRHIQADLQAFRQGDPERGILPGDPWSFVANPNSVLCSPKYCTAHGTEFCHEWQQNR